MSKFTDRLRNTSYHEADPDQGEAQEAADIIDDMAEVLRSLKDCGLVGDDEERRQDVLDRLEKLEIDPCLRPLRL